MNKAICTDPVEVIGDMARTNSYESTKRYETSNYDSLNGFINRAIRETVERDTIKQAANAAGMSIEEYTRAAAIDALKRSQENQDKNPE